MSEQAKINEQEIMSLINDMDEAKAIALLIKTSMIVHENFGDMDKRLISRAISILKEKFDKQEDFVVRTK